MGKELTLNETEMNYLRVLFKCVQDATDRSQVQTKSAYFVDRKIIQDLEQVYLTLGRIGTVTRLCGGK